MESLTLYEAVLRSEAVCRERYRPIQEQIQRYHGPAHTGSPVAGPYDPNNAAWSFITTTVASLSAVSTRVFFSTRRPVVEDRVEALEAYVARWQRDIEYQREREAALVDMCFGTCVLVVEQRPAPGLDKGEKPAYMPRCRRWSPSLFGFDTDAETMDRARFKWHKVIEDRDSFLRNAESEFGWDLEVCKKLAVQSADAARQRKTPSGSPREVIAYFSVWCPDALLAENDAGWGGMAEDERSRCHGVIYTYAVGGEGAMEPRIPIPYFGPRQGPYVTEGYMIVPDEAWSLGPLTAMHGPIQQLNAQTRANDRAAERKKTIAVFNAPTIDGKAAILDANDGDALSIPGFVPGSVEEINLGGLDANAASREIDLGVKVDRGLAISDARRGEVTGAGTAYENMIAAQAGEKQDGMWKARLASIDRRVAAIVSWYADQDERTVAMLDDGVVYVGGMSLEQKLAGVDIAVAQGLLSDQDGADTKLQLQVDAAGDEERMGGFDDLEIEVEVLGDAGLELARMQLIDEVVMSIPAMAQMAPFASAGLKAYMKAKADLLRAPWLETFADWDMAAAMVIEQQEAAAQPAKPPARPKSLNAPPPSQPGRSSGGGMNARKQSTQLRTQGAKKK